MRINPTTITISHFTLELISNILWSGIEKSNADGICNNSITFPVIPIARLHICFDARSKNANTNVLQNICFGSSLSKPTPDIIAFVD